MTYFITALTNDRARCIVSETRTTDAALCKLIADDLERRGFRVVMWEGIVMTGEDFAAWVAFMKTTRGWSGREVARQLECGVNQVAIWSRTGAPAYIGLACAALAYGLPPWRRPAP